MERLSKDGAGPGDSAKSAGSRGHDVGGENGVRQQVGASQTIRVEEERVGRQADPCPSEQGKSKWQDTSKLGDCRRASREPESDCEQAGQEP